MYNPIVGIYELKRFFGLKDLPNSDHRTARVLRCFKNDNVEQYTNFDETPIKFWEKFWCSYTDCVFVDMNVHSHEQVVRVKCDPTKIYANEVIAKFNFSLKVKNPVGIVEAQITDTNQFMNDILHNIVWDLMECGSSVDQNHLRSKVERCIYSSQDIHRLFDLDELNSSITIKLGGSNYIENNVSDIHAQEIKKLLDIAKNSDLEDHEEEELKRLILNGLD